MPAWIHERAKHILAKNPKMDKSQAFAIATQQSHAKGNTPKGYGTSEGKVVAKAKYDKPKKEYKATANPKGLKTPKLSDKPKTKWVKGKLVKTALLATSPVDVEGVSKEDRDKEILRQSIIAELDAANVYEQMAAKALSPKLRSVLLDVAKEEKTHVGEFQALLNAADPEHAREVQEGAKEVKEAEYTLAGCAKTAARIGISRLQKNAFATSQYSGPLGYGGFKQTSYIPPFNAPPLKTAGPPPPKEKRAYDPSPIKGPGQLGNVDMPGMRKMQTPARQLQESKQVAFAKPTKPDASKAISVKFGSASMDKEAVVERLVRMGAMDIPKTPRLLMRKRSPQELAALQEGVERAWSKRVTDPILQKVVPQIERIPENKVTKWPKKYLSYGSKLLAEDPIGIGLMQFTVTPGATEAYIAGKKGLEKAIDVAFPLKAAKKLP